MIATPSFEDYRSTFPTLSSIVQAQYGPGIQTYQGPWAFERYSTVSTVSHFRIGADMIPGNLVYPLISWLRYA
jgi:hypothetical protein